MGKPQTKTSELKVASATQEPSYVVGSFFNGLHIPQESNFDLYQHTQDPHRYVLHGENSTLEYNGDTGKTRDVNDYIVALYDPKEKSVELFKAPMVPASVTSLAHRVHKGPKVKLRGQKFVDQRNALGEAFGTKKAKAAIANLAKNRIDADKLQDMEMDIVDTVTEVTSDMPSAQTMSLENAVERPIPQVDVLATSVEDIYPILGIISPEELNAIRVSSILEEPDAETRLLYMPWTKLEFVASKLKKFVSLGDTHSLQLLYYASLLFGVYEKRRITEKIGLLEALGNKPAEILVDGILERFAVSRRMGAFARSKDRSYTIDPFHEDKLLCYLLALLFHLNGFSLDVTPIAHELNMKPMRMISLLRALGAVVKPISATRAQEMNISKANASAYKVATLRVPFKLPQMIRKLIRK